MKNIVLFVLEKVISIGLIVLGGYTVICHFAKTVPFGIEMPDVLMSIWAYTGGFIGLIIIGAGLYMFLREYLETLSECIIEDNKNLQ